MVKENGDLFRDTVALTVRGDGVDIPPYIIVHSYPTASYASGRRCPHNEDPVKGMNILRMKDYIEHISQYVQKPSLLCMDRLSSHTSAKVREFIDSFQLPSGERMFIPILLAPKTAFLISPLDMGANSAFKAYFHRLDRSTIDLKLRAVQQAWDQVSNTSIKSICLHCGVVGDEPLDSLRMKFTKQVVNLVPQEIADYLDYYDCWNSGQILVEGADLGRGVQLSPPQQLSEGFMDGVYWNNYGARTVRSGWGGGQKTSQSRSIIKKVSFSLKSPVYRHFRNK